MQFYEDKKLLPGLSYSHVILSLERWAEPKQTDNGHSILATTWAIIILMMCCTLRGMLFRLTIEWTRKRERSSSGKEKLNIQENCMRKSSICIQYLCARLLASRHLIHISNFLNGKLIIPLYIECVYCICEMKYVHSHDSIIYPSVNPFTFVIACDRTLKV